jgi:hypothetical protein
VEAGFFLAAERREIATLGFYKDQLFPTKETWGALGAPSVRSRKFKRPFSIPVTFAGEVKRNGGKNLFQSDSTAGGDGFFTAHQGNY